MRKATLLFLLLAVFPASGAKAQQVVETICQSEDYDAYKECVRTRVILADICKAKMKYGTHYWASCRPPVPAPVGPGVPDTACKGWLQDPRSFWGCLEEELHDSQTCLVWMDQLLLELYAVCEFVEPDPPTAMVRAARTRLA